MVGFFVCGEALARDFRNITVVWVIVVVGRLGTYRKAKKELNLSGVSVATLSIYSTAYCRQAEARARIV